MRLIRAEIRNFRSIKSAEIDLEENDCTILIGKNEGGKSNLLRALALLNGSTEVSEGDVRFRRVNDSADQISQVRFFHRLSDEEKTHLGRELASQGLPDVYVTGGDAPMALSEWLDEVAYVVPVPHGRRAIEVPSIDKLHVQTPVLTTRQEPSDRAQPSEMGGNTVASSRPGSTFGDDGMRMVPVTPEQHALFASKLQLALRPRIASCVYWRCDSRSTLTNKTNLSEFAANPDINPDLKAVFDLAGYPDVRQAVHDMTTNVTRRNALLDGIGNVITDRLHLAWDGARVDITFHVNGDQIEVDVKDSRRTFGLDARSEGFRRFMGFLAAVAIRKACAHGSDSLVLYDEPDLSLHPTAAKAMRDELIRLSNTRKVVYATHSIFMVDPLHVHRHFIVKRIGDDTHVDRAKPGKIRDEEVLFQALGHTIFSELREKNIVLEGYRDVQLLRLALNDERGAEHRETLSQFGLCHAGGAPHIPALIALLRLANRECVVVSDDDEAATIARNRVRKRELGGMVWKTYRELTELPGVLTAEDFVSGVRVGDCVRTVMTDLEGEANSLVEAFVIDERNRALTQVDVLLHQCGVDPKLKREIRHRIKDAVFESITGRDLRASVWTRLLPRLVAFVTASASWPTN